MKYLVLLLLLTTTWLYAQDRFLKYKYNENVELVISNVVCPLKELKDKFPYAAVANRIDGEHLVGCFNHKGDDIVIQWYHGDQTILPANFFL